MERVIIANIVMGLSIVINVLTMQQKEKKRILQQKEKNIRLYTLANVLG